MNDKERVYDEQIHPLMAQIIALCTEHKIALLAEFVFCLDGCECHNGNGCGCTTTLLADDYTPSSQQLRALDVLRGKDRGPQMLAITVTTKP